MYKVLEMFDDLQDFKDTKDGRVYRRYEPGDVYPRKGFCPSEERIAELAGEGNVRGHAIIADSADVEPFEEESAEG